MEDFYLNDAKRKFYTDALDHIRSCGDEFWDLDNDVSEHLDIINKNDNVRTMYSRRGRNRTGFGLESYLTICYTRIVEERIKKVIEPSLNLEFAEKVNCQLVTQYKSPRVEKENDEAAPYLKYIVDPEYWNVFNVKFELKGGYSPEHDRFWNILSETLSKL